RQVFECVPHQPRPAAEIENTQRRLQRRQLGVGECAEMEMSAIVESIHHQLVETCRDFIEHVAQSEVRNAADLLELQQDQKPVASRRLQVGTDLQRALITRSCFLQALQAHE